MEPFLASCETMKSNQFGSRLLLLLTLCLLSYNASAPAFCPVAKPSDSTVFRKGESYNIYMHSLASQPLPPLNPSHEGASCGGISGGRGWVARLVYALVLASLVFPSQVAKRILLWQGFSP